MLASEKGKETMNRGEPNVAGGRFIVPVLFQSRQKGDDQRRTQIIDDKVRDLAFRSGRELQQQFDTVTIAEDLLLTSWAGLLPGTSAFVLWLWFPLQGWGGNSRFAEMTLQLLWLLTLLGLANRTQSPTWSGVLAGLGLGISLAVKIDALPVRFITATVVG